MTIHVTLNCLIKAEQKQSLVSFLQENRARVRQFDGCSNVEIFFDEANHEMLIEEHLESVIQHQYYMDL